MARIPPTGAGRQHSIPRNPPTRLLNSEPTARPLVRGGPDCVCGPNDGGGGGGKAGGGAGVYPGGGGGGGSGGGSSAGTCPHSRRSGGPRADSPPSWRLGVQMLFTEFRARRRRTDAPNR